MIMNVAACITVVLQCSASFTVVNAYTVNHTGQVFSLDVQAPLSSNPFIQQSATFFVTNNNVSGGLMPSVDPFTIPTYGSGIIGLYNFDSFIETATTAGLSSYNKGTSNCSLPAPILCPAAILTGDSNTSSISTFINQNGRYGSALSIPPATITFAQIRPGPFTRNQPAIGFSQSLWMKTTTLDSSTGQWTFNDGTVSELQFDNFDITTSRYNKCITCSLRGMNGFFHSNYCLGPTSANLYNWIHVVCTYHAVTNQLTLYVNGTTLPSSITVVTLTDDLLLHGDYQPIGIGNRPGTSSNLLQYATGSSHFEGFIDDVAFWNRALTQEEISDLFRRSTSLMPAPRVVLETENIVRTGNEKQMSSAGYTYNPFANEFSAVVVSWNVSGSSTANTSLTVEISTDNGQNWCKVSNGLVFTDKFHGGPDLICLFPSITLKSRVIWGREQTTLTAFSVNFLSESPLEPTWQNVSIGMNAGGITYYISSWPFVDIFKSGGGTSWPAVRSGTDVNGYPLEIDPALDAPSGVYWITGRNILMCCNNGNYPRGNYTLIAEGKGLISLAWDSGYRKIQTPCRVEIPIIPTSSGIQLTIEESMLGNHVRGIQMWMPGFAPPGKPFMPPPNFPKPSPPVKAFTPTFTPVTSSAPLPLPTSPCQTCLDGIVGYWPFDNTVRDTYSSSEDGTRVILRAFSPAMTGEVAVITGSGSIAPLSDDSRFGKSLIAGSNTDNFAQLFGVGLLQSDPTTGFAASLWFKGTGGMVFERMFSNFQIDVNANNVCCMVNIVSQVCAPLLLIDTATSWSHAVCSYNGTAQQLSLYLNGQVVAAAAGILKFNHGDYQSFGLGNRAGASTNLGQFASNNWHFIGKIDDFAVWKRPLSFAEVWSIYNSGHALSALYPTNTSTISDCITCLNGIASYLTFDTMRGSVLSSNDTTIVIRGSSPSFVGANATITGSGSIAPLIENGLFGSALNIPSGTANWAQVFPSGLKQSDPAVGFSSSIFLRPESVTFSGLVFERMFDNFVLLTSPVNNNLKCSVTGINGLTYSASYNVNGGGPLDVQKWIHTVCTYDGTSKTLKLYADGKVKATVLANLTDGKFRHDDSQPLGLGNRAGSFLNPAQYSITNHFIGALDDFALWSRALTADEVIMLYASGKPLHLQGQTTLYMPYAMPSQKPSKNSAFKPKSAKPSSKPSHFPSSNPTRVLMPTIIASNAPVTFHPEYLKSLKDFTIVRFMDWGVTNSAQHAKWNQRNTPSSVSQARSYTTTREVVSIRAANGTAFLGGRVVLVSTIAPHDLVTGQRITISNSSGGATMTNGATTNFDVEGSMVQVVDDLSFFMVYGPWWWDASYIAQNITDGNQGTLSVTYSPGVSLEHQVELCNTLGVDGWFNIPHLADDYYIFKMAELINNTLAKNLKAYIEYSNEVWNWSPGFYQTRYASAMASLEGDAAGNRHLTWYGRKAAHVFSIFESVFGILARSRLVRVVAVQAGSGGDQLSQIGIGGADALAIAPYFGHSLNSLLYNSDWKNTTTDQILDMARKLILSDTLAATKASAAIAKSYGMKLIAYEGGQHFGGGGLCGTDDCSQVADLQAKFMAANHNPRMKGLYRNMLKAWSIGGGSTFVAFSHIGYDSRYGSWGALQYQLEDRNIAWKWQALIENIAGTSKQSTMVPTKKASERPSKKPTKKPIAKPSTKPSSNPSKKPSKKPIARPSKKPSRKPSSKPSKKPSKEPNKKPSNRPSKKPSIKPLIEPARSPVQPIQNPSMQSPNTIQFIPVPSIPFQPASKPTQTLPVPMKVFQPIAKPTQLLPVPIKPVTVPTQPLAAPMKPLDIPKKPLLAAPIKPVTMPMRPLAAPMNPVTMPTRPFVAPLKPLVMPTQPFKAPMKPLASPLKPVMRPMQTLAAPMKPVPMPAQPLAAPKKLVAMPLKPVNPVSNPMQSLPGPVKPLSKPMQPVQQPFKPIAKPK